MISANEIRDGLVLRLDPDELESRGGRCTGEPAYRVQGPHFFLCLAANEDASNWVPLFPDPGPRRDLLDNANKLGPLGWRGSETFFHTEQVWQAPPAAVVEAAIIGGDLSQADQRNFVNDAGIDAVYEIVFGEPA
ncbi:MAG: hypothetical protein AAGC67_01610 [Myxococcota bacterium]